MENLQLLNLLIRKKNILRNILFKIQKGNPSTDTKIQAIPTQYTLRINIICQIIGLNGLFKTFVVHSPQLFH